MSDKNKQGIDDAIHYISNADGNDKIDFVKGLVKEMIAKQESIVDYHQGLLDKSTSDLKRMKEEL